MCIAGEDSGSIEEAMERGDISWREKEVYWEIHHPEILPWGNCQHKNTYKGISLTRFSS